MYIIIIGLAVLFLIELYVVISGGINTHKGMKKTEDTSESYNIETTGHNTYSVSLTLYDGGEFKLYLRSDKELKRTQLYALLAKLEAEKNIKSGVFSLNSETFELTEVVEQKTRDNIINLEKMRDVNNENATSVKDTDIELNRYSRYIN